jgi:hypothetical protein
MATNEHDEHDARNDRGVNGEQHPVTQPEPGEQYVVDYDAVPAEEDRTVRETEMYDPVVDEQAAAPRTADGARSDDAHDAHADSRPAAPVLPVGSHETHETHESPRATHADATDNLSASDHDAAASHTGHDGTLDADRASDARVRDEDTRDHSFAPAAAGVAGTAGAASVAAARHDDTRHDNDSRADRTGDADRAANTDNTATAAHTDGAHTDGAHADGDLTDRERAAIRDERGTTTTTAHTVNDEERRSIQVQAPTTPVKRSNRGFGIGVMLLSSLVFAAIYGAIIYLVTFFFLDPSVDDGTQGVLQALGTPVFWVPVLVYLVACILWVLIVNRAGGWLHVLFGLIVGVLAYASVVAVLSVTASLAESRPEDFTDFVFRSLIDSRALLAFIVARELPIWFGAWVGRRGRKLREQHAEARRVYDDELAAQSDRSRVG